MSDQPGSAENLPATVPASSTTEADDYLDEPRRMLEGGHLSLDEV